MDDDFIVTTGVVLAKMRAALGHRDPVLAPASDAEVLPVAVVAAQSFQHHRERAVQLLRRGGPLSGALSVSRCNRRLHRRRAWLLRALETPGALFAAGAALLIDGLPVPAGRRARARRCRKLRGQARAVLRLAAAPGRHPRRAAGRLRPAAGRPGRQRGGRRGHHPGRDGRAPGPPPQGD
jgi:hypothetical protein